MKTLRSTRGHGDLVLELGGQDLEGHDDQVGRGDLEEFEDLVEQGDLEEHDDLVLQLDSENLKVHEGCGDLVQKLDGEDLAGT